MLYVQVEEETINKEIRLYKQKETQASNYNNMGKQMSQIIKCNKL